MSDHLKFAKHPSLTIYHPNGKGTGAAMSLSLVPARVGDPDGGFLFLRIAPQTGSPEVPHYDWLHDLDARLKFADLGKLLEVFRGCKESLEDGKGIYQTDADNRLWRQVVKMHHQLEPTNGYWIEVARKYNDLPENAQRVGIFLAPHEAVGLSLAIEHSLAAVCFGVSEWRMA